MLAYFWATLQKVRKFIPRQKRTNDSKNNNNNNDNNDNNNEIKRQELKTKNK